MMIRRSSLVLATLVLGGVLAAAACSPDPGDGSGISLRTVSTHAEHVSGGDVLVEVTLDAEAGGGPAVTVNGEDVTGSFHANERREGRWVGLLTGLPEGASEVVARLGNQSASLTLANYPVTGPIVSGPHHQPFICQTERFELPDGTVLGPPLDQNCSVEDRVIYLYLAKGDSALRALPDPSALPDDVAETTTLAGVAVPFVVRLET